MKCTHLGHCTHTQDLVGVGVHGEEHGRRCWAEGLVLLDGAIQRLVMIRNVHVNYNIKNVHVNYDKDKKA